MRDGLHQNKTFSPFLSYFILFLIYTSTFRIFATLPLETLHQTLSTFSIIVLTVFYLFHTFINLKNLYITKLDVLMWMVVVVNFFAAHQGFVVFKQPYYFGIMAQRSVILSFSGILIITLLEKGYITIEQVEKSFVAISLVLLVIFYSFFLFVNPERFVDQEFVVYSPIRGYRYRFQFGIVIMLLFYSLFKISEENKRRFYIPVILILFYLIFFLQSRTTLVVMAIVLMIYFIRNFTLREKLRNTLIGVPIFLVSLLIMFSLGYTSLFEKYQVLYQNVLSVFLGETTDEASSAVRFMEFNTALSYIDKNPILGNGFISNQWNGGWRDLLGYFYPVDIGILGNIFVFGILGTFLLYLPFLFSLHISRAVNSKNVFFKTCEYMILFFFLSMFFTAVNIRDTSSIMFIVCLLYYFRYYYFKDSVKPTQIT
ncbi:MAG: O-antigen ligase family protein [Bacteroidota bacterium]